MRGQWRMPRRPLGANPTPLLPAAPAPARRLLTASRPEDFPCFRRLGASRPPTIALDAMVLFAYTASMIHAILLAVAWQF